MPRRLNFTPIYSTAELLNTGNSFHKMFGQSKHWDIKQLHLGSGLNPSIFHFVNRAKQVVFAKTDVTPVILSCNVIAQLNHATKLQYATVHVTHCNYVMSHKQELTNQHSQHSGDKVAQNTALLYSKMSCVTVQELHNTPCHTCNFVTR